jgi:hypothetical protein
MQSFGFLKESGSRPQFPNGLEKNRPQEIRAPIETVKQVAKVTLIFMILTTGREFTSSYHYIYQ